MRLRKGSDSEPDQDTRRSVEDIESCLMLFIDSLADEDKHDEAYLLGMAVMDGNSMGGFAMDLGLESYEAGARDALLWVLEPDHDEFITNLRARLGADFERDRARIVRRGKAMGRLDDETVDRIRNFPNPFGEHMDGTEDVA